MSALPIRLRVTAAFAAAMAAVLACTGLFLYVRLASHLSTALDRDLKLRAQDVAALVTVSSARLSADTGARLVERGESYAQLVDANGNVLDATRPLGRARLLTPVEVRQARSAPLLADRDSVPGLDEPSRLLATSVDRNGRHLVLIVGATLQDRAETLASFRDELLLAGPIALMLASAIGYAVAGLALRQVESMRVRAAAISAQTPGERLPVPPTGDELQRLGETLNEMLDRLQAAIERERDLVADAGHELRTPLALLRTELELAVRHAQTADELREAMARASDEADRLSQLAEGLLLIARSDGGRLPLAEEDVSLDEVLGAVTSRYLWRHDTLRVEQAPGLRIHCDRLRVEQALGNLVDNAIRHGDDPVEIFGRTVDGRIELHVRDGGPGFPRDFVGRAFERFTRPDAARGRGGAGLGLSIVRTIAEAHGGSAHAANRLPSGADVWISLPLERSE